MRIKVTAIILIAMSYVLMPAMTFAASNPLLQACDKVDASNSSICNNQNTTTNPVNHILHIAADIVALLAGLAAVILIIVSGISLITSGGNTDTVANARKRITNAIIGLIIIAFAWTIITFLTDKLIT
jgi:hypothetical protein